MKKGVQSFGRFLSGMVMPNIGAFIAWGLITALFIDAGWLPNSELAAMVGPMLTYLLPILIAFTGGKMIGDIRGGVTGAIMAFGIIIYGTTTLPNPTTMLLGAMVCGPLGGVFIKYFDKAVHGKIPAGFEMIVNNFSIGIFGTALAVIAYYGLGPMVVILVGALGTGVDFLVTRGLLPLASLLVEPAKVLFLNNAINHGVFTPLGAEQVAETGKSIMYMIEANPGPGFGLLLAYMFFGKGTAKSSAPGAAIIHFFGGIHEIYFPFVLMNPILILATMAGGASGVFTLTLLDGGLVGAAAPGSIIAMMIMTPADSYFANIMGILVATVVTFVLSAVLLKAFGKDEDIEAAQAKMKGMKSDSKGTASAAVEAVQAASTATLDNVKKIIFACDAGMGSSAMGATKLRKKLKNAGLEGIEVKHAPVSEIPEDADVIVTHSQLKERAAASNPDAYLVPIHDFLNAPEYDKLIEDLKEKAEAK